MNILSIGTDKNLFNEKSGVFSRILEYSKLVDNFFVFVFVHKNKGFDYKRSRNLHIYPINYSSKLFSFFNLYFLMKKVVRGNNLNKKNCLIVSQDPFEVGLFSWVLKKIFKFKLEIQVHGDFLSSHYKNQSWRHCFQVFLGKRVLRRADQVRTVSLRSENKIINKLKIKPEKIINLPILFLQKKEIGEVNKNYLKEKYPQFKFIILMASRLVKEKNIKLVISVFDDLNKNYSDTGLLILGSGPEEENLKKMANNKNIVFLGWVDDLDKYYSGADVFLISSDHEGWAMTAIEATAFGLPVVMTDVGCANEFIKNNYNGIIFPVGDKEKMFEVLEFLILNESERRRMSQNSLESYKLLTERNYLQELKDSWINCLKS